MSNHNANTLSAPLLVSPPSTEVGGGSRVVLLSSALPYPPTYFQGERRVGEGGKEGM